MVGALSLLPPQLGPAAPSCPPAPTALRSAALAAAAPQGSGARAVAAAPPPPRPPSSSLPFSSRRALHPPPPPPASAASTPRALSHWEIPLLLHSPLRLPPTRGRVTQIPAWAAAGRGRGRRPPGPGLGLFPPPPPRNPEGGPFTRQLGGTKWAPGRGRLPRVPLRAGGGGGKEGNGGGGREGTPPRACSPAAK